MFDRRFKVRLLTALALVVAIVLCFIVFFRVKTVSITGNEKYTQEEILAASGLEEGDALLLVNKSSVASKIIAQLPYVNQIRIGISMPDTVRVEIEELDTAYMVTADDGTYWLMNSQGRVVEEVTAKDSSNYLMVSGFQIEAPEPGDTISASKKETPVQPEQTDETDQTDQTDQSGEESQTDQTEQDTASEEQTTPDDSTPKERMEVALEILSYLEESQDTAGITQVDVSSLNDIKYDHCCFFFHPLTSLLHDQKSRFLYSHIMCKLFQGKISSPGKMIDIFVYMEPHRRLRRCKEVFFVFPEIIADEEILFAAYAVDVGHKRLGRKDRVLRLSRHDHYFIRFPKKPRLLLVKHRVCVNDNKIIFFRFLCRLCDSPID